MTFYGLLILTFLTIYITGGSCEINCTVNKLKTAENFDPDKFEGLWYAYVTLTDTPIQDISHTYVKDGDGNVTVYLRERVPGRNCTYYHLKLVNHDPGSEENSKFVQIDDNGDRTPFWILGTDYSSFAIAYGCLKVDGSTGKCQQINSWVWTRDKFPIFDQNRLDNIQAILSGACTDLSQYRRIIHNNQGCRQCRPDQWTVQGNFQLQSFMGSWYVQMVIKGDNPISWRETYQEFSLDGNQIQVKSKGRSLLPTGDLGECINLPSGIIKPGKIPGQMVFQVNNTEFDYRVVDLDYSKHAFVLGCTDIDPVTGNCGKYISWILTRDGFLSNQDALWILKTANQFCVPDYLYLTSDNPQDCSCAGIMQFLSTGPLVYISLLSGFLSRT